MNNLPEEKIKEIEETRRAKEAEEIKVHVKKMNVDAVGKVLTNMQNENYEIKSEQVDLKRMVSKATQDITALRTQINELKTIGAKGTLGGTGSTVHKKGE